jgi:BTB/POZ domain
MLELLNNPLFSDLTLYISNKNQQQPQQQQDTQNNNNNNTPTNNTENTRSSDARTIFLHKCIVYSRFREFPQFFMGGNAEATEIDVFGYNYDVVYNAMQILYPIIIILVILLCYLKFHFHFILCYFVSNKIYDTYRYADWAKVKQGYTDQFTRFTTQYHLERVTRLFNEGDEFVDAQPAQVDATQSLAQDFTALLRSELLTDVTFCAQGERFRAHRAVLAARSAYFRALLSGQMRESHAHAEVELGNDAVDAHAFKTVLHHLYAAPVDLAQSGLDLLGVLELCCRYLIEDLRVQVTRFLIEHLDMENAIALYEAAMVLDCPELKLACMEFIGR